MNTVEKPREWVGSTGLVWRLSVPSVVKLQQLVVVVIGHKWGHRQSKWINTRSLRVSYTHLSTGKRSTPAVDEDSSHYSVSIRASWTNVRPLWQWQTDVVAALHDHFSSENDSNMAARSKSRQRLVLWTIVTHGYTSVGGEVVLTHSPRVSCDDVEACHTDV